MTPDKNSSSTAMEDWNGPGHGIDLVMEDKTCSDDNDPLVKGLNLRCKNSWPSIEFSFVFT